MKKTNGNQRYCLRCTFKTTISQIKSQKLWEGDYGWQEVKTVLEPRPSPFANRLHHRKVCILNQLASVHPFLKSQWAASLSDALLLCIRNSQTWHTIYSFIFIYFLLFILPFYYAPYWFAYLLFLGIYVLWKISPTAPKKDPKLCSVM